MNPPDMVPGKVVPGTQGGDVMKPGCDFFGKSGIMTGVPRPGKVTMMVRADPSGGKFFLDPIDISGVEGLPRFAYEQGEVVSMGPVVYDAAVYYMTSPRKGFSSTSAVEDTAFIRRLISAIGG